MEPFSANFHKIQEHIELLERNQKRKVFFTFLLFLPLVLGLLFIVYSQLRQSFLAETSSSEREVPIFYTPHIPTAHVPKTTDKGIEVSEAVDTIPLIAYLQEQEMLDPVSPSELTRSYLDARGPRNVGDTLAFTIANFKPDVQYTIDFGNGVSQTVPSGRLEYVYSEEGTYIARVIGIYDGREILSKKLSLSIRNASEKGSS